MRWFWNHYCPDEQARLDPAASPLRVADASGLPPAFVRVAELDPLREEGLAFAAKLEAAGVAVNVACDEGMLHGYWSGAGVVEPSTAAVEQAGAWMKSCVRSAMGRWALAG
jgi:acetyl esterase